jgi:hypothetical protein
MVRTSLLARAAEAGPRTRGKAAAAKSAAGGTSLEPRAARIELQRGVTPAQAAARDKPPAVKVKRVAPTHRATPKNATPRAAASTRAVRPQAAQATVKQGLGSLDQLVAEFEGLKQQITTLQRENTNLRSQNAELLGKWDEAKVFARQFLGEDPARRVGPTPTTSSTSAARRGPGRPPGVKNGAGKSKSDTDPQLMAALRRLLSKKELTAKEMVDELGKAGFRGLLSTSVRLMAINMKPGARQVVGKDGANRYTLKGVA